MYELPETAPVRVLFVDDEENMLKSLSRVFMDEEFEVITAPSAREGLRILMETEDVGVIVSDQRMPEITGVQFLAQVREMFPETLRIMLTGYADISATVDAINRGGAYRYITKPWNDEELVQIIRDAVNQYRLVQENRRLTEIVNKQNEELKEWNENLKVRVLEQTTEIRKKHENLKELNERLRSNFKDTVTAFSRLIELGGKKRHAETVATLAMNIAQAMGVSAGEVETVHNAALLHDIGELGIADAILKKDLSEMTPGELREYMLHAVRGQTAIDAIEELTPAGVLIRHHHEHYDGSGYPDGLRGEAIPLGSRIIAIADFLDRAIQKLHGYTAIDYGLRSVAAELGKKLDPSLYESLRKFAKHVYYVKETDTRKLGEVEVGIAELFVGQVLSRDIYSGTGLLLLNRGVRLDVVKIEAIRRYYRLDPPPHGVFVEV
ncbi:response regulator receiver modulated metal dependent phosphohydrolase [Geobacter metallireducens RCH3]|uniref:Response receiver-modulated cyclic diguanylate phosphodiesterase n=1 Tax=Geobacter metallireducens (strain ATCC 53774 / DSM 7210 / GS-15) TaxID=269799 RepID=Q39PZ0_GEOMG|nr:HD domain-containing phosphohydrolase [Geobacter metallireducens]ABB33684.2 response receiver-modulated cyclic diguanylate phosphodiesterase [Geobacter metallireducens GS-15]EHP85380.1 response regulator receiver modulated metal dependent phosphohydrolase [Geobacter metallireducens RCH3]